MDVEKLKSDRERLLLACRKAVLTLAHAAQANHLYEEDYQELSRIIAEVTTGTCTDVPAKSPETLSQRLIKTRAAYGWSQADLAEACGVAAAQISRYESGRSDPRPTVVMKLAKGLKVDFHWLLTGSEYGLR